VHKKAKGLERITKASVIYDGGRLTLDLTYMYLMKIIPGVTSGAGTTYPSGEPEFTPGF
jgi:hypothetical protein